MDPFKEMNQWKDNLHHFFGGDFWNEFEHLVEPRIPAVTIYEVNDKILVYVTLPGINNRKHVNISIDSYSLHVKGRFPKLKTQGELHINEIPRGEFSRKIDLPVAVQREKATAQLRDGLMVIHLYKNKKQSERTKNIPVEIVEDES